jgi:hypothetical protein
MSQIGREVHVPDIPCPTLLREWQAPTSFPPNAISKVHFSPAGSAVTGLHCIGSMNRGVALVQLSAEQRLIEAFDDKLVRISTPEDHNVWLQFQDKLQR